MTEYGLQPSYVRLDWSSPFGVHSQTIPTKQWLSPSITGGMGSYENWNGLPIDAEAMIDALVLVAKPFLSTDYNYDLASIFNYDSGALAFINTATKPLAVAGTGATAMPRKAVSQTFNLRTVGGNPFKMVFLDSSHAGGDFEKQRFIDFNAAALALVNELGDADNAWSGRDNTRPYIAVSATYDLNEALRKQYRMV